MRVIKHHAGPTDNQLKNLSIVIQSPVKHKHIETMKKELTKHIFINVENREVAVFAETEEQARLQLSHAEEYRHLRVETVPLIHAEFAQGLLEALNVDWLGAGSRWTAHPNNDEHPDSWFHFIRADGLAFWSHESYPKGRVEFRYSRPYDSKKRLPDVYTKDGSQFVAPRIACSLSKSGEQLAKDIVRRLLPDCEAAEVLCLEAVKIQEARYIKRNEAQEVADSLGSASGLRFSANDTSVHVSGYVSPDVAKEIHKLLSK